MTTMRAWRHTQCTWSKDGVAKAVVTDEQAKQGARQEAMVWCMPGFDPGSQSNKRRRIVQITARHPAYASCPHEFSKNLGIVLYKIAHRSSILEGPPRIVTDQWDEQHIEMKLIKPNNGALDFHLLRRQIESIEIGKGSGYQEITFQTSKESLSAY
jgi:hypothetical protein